MKNIKIIIPMLAFVMAIGLSFAVEHKTPGDLVLNIDGVLYQSPIDCQGQEQNCTATISKDGVEQEVQVMRENADGDYEQALTGVKDDTVYPFSSLIEVTP